MTPKWRTQGTVSDGHLLLVVVGVALVATAFKGLLWYSVDQAHGVNVAGTGFTFDDLGGNADTLVAPVASAYFDWLAWTLLIAVAVIALLANIPTPASDALRVASFLIGTTGVVATYYAVAQLFNAQRAAGGSAQSVWHNSSFGFWGALVGFALATVGGVFGPHRAS